MPASVLPGAEPYQHDGSDTGVLLVHGYTGSPQGLRPWAEHLAAEGYTVRLPLLPGHGTTWKDLNRTRWTDWYAEVERTFDELRSRCTHVVVAGLSMGGLLATKLALEQGPR
ncbi:MAG: alpha/beta fold hydrolase, partial [Actinomycetota bacterium]|nr:alpha/beta fold hydrolase [Actinomycetota bacterium]